MTPQKILEKRWEQVKEYVVPLIKPTDKILDIGCGDGYITERLKPHCKLIYAIDKSYPQLPKKDNYHHKNFKFMDFYEFRNIFDIVLALGSYHKEQDEVVRYMNFIKMFFLAKRMLVIRAPENELGAEIINLIPNPCLIELKWNFIESRIKGVGDLWILQK